MISMWQDTETGNQVPECISTPECAGFLRSLLWLHIFLGEGNHIAYHLDHHPNQYTYFCLFSITRESHHLRVGSENRDEFTFLRCELAFEMSIERSFEWLACVARWIYCFHLLKTSNFDPTSPALFTYSINIVKVFTSQTGDSSSATFT